MAAPAQSYSIEYNAFLHPLGSGSTMGYAATKSADGTGYVIATTAAMAASASGSYHGIMLETQPVGCTIQIQSDAIVDPSVCPWLGTGIVEDAVVDGNGKVWRASQSAGTAVGTVFKDGSVELKKSSAAATTLGGDADGPALSNTVRKILGATVAALAGNVGKALVLTGASAFGFVSFGTAASGYDTADHGGGGQEVLSATGSGGVFTVHDDVSQKFSSSTQPSAQSGMIRAPAAAAGPGYSLIAVRNPGNTADRNAIGAYLVGAATSFKLGDSAITYQQNLLNTGVDIVGVGGTTQVSLTASLLTLGPALAAGIPLAFGSAPAQSGTLRLQTGFLAAFRNNAGSADRVFLASDASDIAYFGDVTQAGLPAVIMGGPIGLYSTTPATLQATINASGVTVATLAGAGTRMVTCTAAGLLGASAIPGGTPGGSDRQVQYNNAGAFGGAANVTYDTGGTLTVLSAIQIGASNWATAGGARFANNAGVKFRNAAANGNVDALNVDSSNNILVGGTGTAGAFVDGVSGATLRVNGANILSCSASQITALQFLSMGSNYIAFGSIPASAAALRLSNNQGMYGRNVGNSGDIVMIVTDASDNLFVGDGTYTANLLLRVKSGASINHYFNGVSKLSLSEAVCSIQATNVAIGELSPNFNSATNAVYIKDGLVWSSGPSNGFYMRSDSGRPHLRNGNSPPSGVAVDIIYDRITSGDLESTPRDLLCVIVKDHSGNVDIVRYIPLYASFSGTQL